MLQVSSVGLGMSLMSLIWDIILHMCNCTADYGWWWLVSKYPALCGYCGTFLVTDIFRSPFVTTNIFEHERFSYLSFSTWKFPDLQFSICVLLCRARLQPRYLRRTLAVRGIFAGARVMRGVDWRWGDQDGMYVCWETGACHKWSVLPFSYLDTPQVRDLYVHAIK